MLGARISSYGCTRKFGEHERSVRVARGAAESNSSFLSALQTSQVHPLLDIRTAKSMNYPWVGRCGPAPHTLTLFKTNITDFPTLFKTELRFLIPCLRHLKLRLQEFVWLSCCVINGNLMCLVSMPKSTEVNIN